jgi:hypothetical protein
MPGSTQLAQRLFSALLRLYPAAYRRHYGDPLQQTFRDQLREAHTLSEVLRVTISALSDLFCSLPSIHRHERNQAMKSLKLHVVALFTIMVLFLGRYETRTDDSGVIAFFIALFAFLLAYLQPSGAKLWALVGLGVPLVHVFSPHRLINFQNPLAWAGLALFVLTLGTVGSFFGTQVRRISLR